VTILKRARRVLLTLTVVTPWTLLVGGLLWPTHRTASPTAALDARQQQAVFDAAYAYGRSGKPRCNNYLLAVKTAHWALSANLPASVVAAKVAKESSCNPYAISSKGAIGLGQVRPAVWCTGHPAPFDCQKLNLFDVDDNLYVATSILGQLMEEKGDLRTALRCYNGAGCKGQQTADYADAILRVARYGP